jgi:hypothetical protein
MTGIPQRDPSAAYTRKVIAARKKGVGSRCKCGEARPEALIREKNRVICHQCKRKEKAMKTEDDHHFAGQANSPITVPVPVNDHRAELTPAQQDWPRGTLQNPNGSPLLAAAASVRGAVDTIIYLIKKGLHWIADMLEKLDAMLAQKWGEKWWIGTEIEKYVPKC